MLFCVTYFPTSHYRVLVESMLTAPVERISGDQRQIWTSSPEEILTRVRPNSDQTLHLLVPWFVHA